MEKRTVYLISGPAGVGKSTTTKKLGKSLKRSAYIEGDLIDHMVAGGYVPPWESEELTALIWKNIISLCNNFLDANMDVVIDYITFPADAAMLKEAFQARNIELVYVVLMTDKEELLKRDSLRSPNAQMKERCLVLVDEFMDSELQARFILNTSGMTTEDLPAIISNIKTDPSFKL
ncbi:hypothetical protein CU633_18435 [Bacillus sp. V3-13]|uniref:AAA family ATPase n=1 Tax=Bacillus sp. V3-13 TaxID=2053728 RepID=UPI000C773AA2|nr:AAA family ATPase [Bacillus sp. V3-13]PLR75860.1 hypothetical protein CU633_18435 [Bacillus sp. V3-13]